MSVAIISRDEVVDRGRTLPAFPRIVMDILATLDDPESSLRVLVEHIEHDPAVAARVLSRANRIALRSKGLSDIHNLFTATSLIGINTVRELTVIGNLRDFVDRPDSGKMSSMYWRHSVAVGMCCEELTLYTGSPVPSGTALVVGLLHDIGQIWLHCFRREAFATVWEQALGSAVGIEKVESERFGVDHSTIGFWLAEHWRLPADIGAAIRYHHAPEAALNLVLPSLVHVAEVVSNALDLTDREENSVTELSTQACKKLNLEWNEKIRPVFGRIEARTKYALQAFGD